MRIEWIGRIILLCGVLAAAPAGAQSAPASPNAAPPTSQPPPPAPMDTGCEGPLAASDRPGPVFRNARLSIADNAAGTLFTLSGCVLNNAPPGSFAGFLINGLIFDDRGNLIVAGSTETNPVPSGNPAPDQTLPAPPLQPWTTSPNAGYRVAHGQVRPVVMLIVYSRACPDGGPTNCAKPYDTGPFYILLSPCVTDDGAIVAATAASCPAAAPPAPAAAATTAPATAALDARPSDARPSARARRPARPPSRPPAAP